MKLQVAILLISVFSVFYTTAQQSKSTMNFYQFKAESLQGKEISMKDYKGKVVMIVNTASKCGFTPQYEGLEKLYKEYKDKGLVILGFPCNQFGGQEPGTAEEIQTFCKKNYGVNFPLAEKIDVKGDNISPVYKWLCNKTENGVLDATITWNFNKFLLDENGKLLAYFPSKVTPDSEEILKYLK